MRPFFIATLILSTLILSCGNDNDESINQPATTNQNPIYTVYDESDTAVLGKTYMPTGFYYLTDKKDGVKMLKEQSNEVYKISRTPFVAVDNILRASLVKTKLESGISSSIQMVMNNKGTRDLKQGTGNFAHPYIAVVIANRLLYVVENNYKTETGIMTIILANYPEKVMEEMLDAIRHKR